MRPHNISFLNWLKLDGERGIQKFVMIYSKGILVGQFIHRRGREGRLATSTSYLCLYHLDTSQISVVLTGLNLANIGISHIKIVLDHKGQF